MASSYTDVLFQEISRLHPDARIEQLDPVSARLHFPDGSTQTVNSTPIANDGPYPDEESLRTRLASFLNSIRFEPVTKPGVVPWQSLRPSVRLQTTVTASPYSEFLIGRPIGPHLVEMVVVDLADKMSLVNRTTIRDWDVPDEQLYVAARANLAAMNCECGFFSVDGVTSLLRVTGPDSYQSSWALFPDRMQALMHGPARPLVFIPSRDTCLVVPEDRLDLIDRALDAAMADYTRYVRPISPAAYLSTPDGLQPWLPAQPGRLYNKALFALCRLAADEYENQRSFLAEQGTPAAGEARPVRLESVTFPDGRPPLTYAPVTEDAFRDGPQLIPAATHVAVQPAGPGPMAMVTWRDFGEVCGELITDTDHEPRRWIISRWPDPIQLAELRRRAVM